jgi:hypothetical protein
VINSVWRRVSVLWHMSARRARAVVGRGPKLFAGGQMRRQPGFGCCQPEGGSEAVAGHRSLAGGIGDDDTDSRPHGGQRRISSDALIESTWAIRRCNLSLSCLRSRERPSPDSLIPSLSE